MVASWRVLWYNKAMIENEKTYDSVFWTSVVDMKEYFVPLVNELFGEHFTDKAIVKLHPGKQTVEHTDGSFEQRNMDAFAILTENSVSKPYHVEVETWYKSGIILRIAEYSLVSASESRMKTEKGARVRVPQSALIVLRPENGAPDSYVIEYDFGNQIVEQKVPILQIKDYSVSDLFEKRLLLLVPFVGFAFEPRFAEMEKGGIDDLKKALDEVSESLIRMVEAGEIDESKHSHMLDWLKRVMEKLTVNYGNVKKGVDDLMSGYILHTRTDEILDEGANNEMRRRIEIMLRKGKTPEDIADFCDYPIDLVKEVEQSMMAVV